VDTQRIRICRREGSWALHHRSVERSRLQVESGFPRDFSGWRKRHMPSSLLAWKSKPSMYC
jgi:hypothetical protein